MTEEIDVLLRINGKIFEGKLHPQAVGKQTEKPNANPPAIPEIYAALLTIKDEGAAWVLRPKEFLRPEDFAEILNIVKGKNGHYVSAGKFSHFSIPK